MPSQLPLSEEQKQKLIALASAAVDQEKAKVIVPPQDDSTGYWFGGGNVVQDRDGSILICGRYRNHGDSRTGLGFGARGLELAIFRADSPQGEFEKIHSWTKPDLVCNGREVISIEGVALHLAEDGIELFISTEKDAPYPERLADFQKPGTGVWSIDRIHADRVEDLSPGNIEEVVPFGTEDPGRLHCKDPWVFDFSNGDLVLGYCTHPFTWASSGTGALIRRAGSDNFEKATDDLLARGPSWDISAARVTERLAVPRTGAFAEGPDLSLYFYDSCESLRQLDENPKAASRPRGWSCEEIGGLAAGVDADFPVVESLTTEFPLFISPHGTGCSRYVAALATEEGIFTNWQQSQENLSQPLVSHFLPQEEIEKILA